MTDRLLQTGDVVERKTGRVAYLYVVLGHTPRGKTRFRRVAEGTELTAWWPRERDMPSNYRVTARMEEAA